MRLDKSGPMGSIPPSNRRPIEYGSTSMDLFDSSGSSFSSEAELAAQQIIDRIKASAIYRMVYSVFYNDEPDKYWLIQLEGILNAVVGSASSWTDDLGLTSSSSDKNNAVYNEAINNISSLYNQYRSYKNSLPITQVQQLSNAGINAAITGNGVNGSTLDVRENQSGAASMVSNNSGQFVSEFANFALNTVSGLTSVLTAYADVAIKFRDLDLRERAQTFNEQSSFADFKKSLSDIGVMLRATSWSELDTKDPDWSDNANARSKALYNAYKEYTDSLSYGPTLIHGVTSGQYDDKYFGSTIQADGLHDSFGAGQPYGYYGASLSRDYAELGSMQVELAMAKAQHSVEVGQSLIADGLTPDDIAASQAKEQKANSNYNARKATIFLSRLEKLVHRSKSGDPVASIELINMMQSADWQESLIYIAGELNTDALQIIGSTLPEITSWGTDNFVKCIDFFHKKIKNVF